MSSHVAYLRHFYSGGRLAALHPLADTCLDSLAQYDSEDSLQHIDFKSFDFTPIRGIPESRGGFVFTFLRKFHTVFQMIQLIYILTNSCHRFLFSSLHSYHLLKKNKLLLYQVSDDISLRFITYFPND